MSKQICATRKLRILIVDDDDVLRRWLRVQLEPRGFEVWEESHCDEAFAAYAHHGPWDFVLSDLYFFPGEQVKNGLDFTRKIAAMNPEQRMAIHTSEKGFQASVPVLTKPYSIGRLLRLLCEPSEACRRCSMAIEELLIWNGATF